MDWSKLSQNEKLAVYGSVAAIVGLLIGGIYTSGIGWLAVLAGIGMLVVVFLPMMSPTSSMPGSKGSFMLIAGGIAAIAALLALLLSFGYGFFLGAFVLQFIFFLIGVAGSLVMGWAGWQEFQAEGGKFQIGSGGTGSGSGGSAPPPPGAPSS